ncbi:MAG TPA: sugar-binding transcriptional regulator [Limnochordia bacterium]|nr:sugar-binding transcriptional regulator [Limnochordia bacterium]
MLEQDAELYEKVHIAWLYYMENLTQSEIADRLGLTRLMVHRILQKCLQEGLVHVVINHPQVYCQTLGSQLEATFDLKNALVIPSSPDPQVQKRNLGTVSARLIGRFITNGTTVGVGWGSTLAETARYLLRKNHDNVTVVSLMGGMIKSAGNNSYEVALQVAEALNAVCYNYMAPMFVDTPEDRETIMRLRHIEAVRQLARKASVAVIGLGEVSAECTFARSGVITAAEVDELMRAGAVADILGNFIDLNGQLVDVDLNRRVVGATLEDLAAIENVFVVAGGLRKAQAISAALRSGCVDYIITDAETAEQVLQLNRAL